MVEEDRRPAPRRAALLVMLVLALLVGASLAGAGSAVAATGTDTTADLDGARAFVRDALWTRRGTSVDFPDHVVFPSRSLRVLQAMEATGALGAVDPAAAARAAANVQTSSGGFLPFAGAFLGPTTEATGAGAALTVREGVAFDEAGAEAWLRSMQNPDGGFGPRKSLSGGNLGSRVSSTHYAVLGLDALDALDGETRREVHLFLLRAQNADGGWADTPGGDTSGTSATYHAVRTLELLGTVPGTDGVGGTDGVAALDPATKARVRGFLSLVEDPHGGFLEWYTPPTCYFCEDEPPSVPATGRALLTLAAVGGPLAGTHPDAARHADWLAERQVDDGPLKGAFPLFGEAPPSVVHQVFDVAESVLGEDPVPRPFPRPDPPVTDWSRNTALALAGTAATGTVDALDAAAAQDFLAACQHRGTGGFGWWPGYLEELDATEAAYRALDRVGPDGVGDGDALAATLDGTQRADGAIVPTHWDLPARLDHTAHALLVLDRVGRLDVVDVDAAAGWLASEQDADGGFSDPILVSDVEATWYVVWALNATGRLDAIDTEAVAGFLADLQKDDGRITDVRPGDRVATWDTGRALRTLAVLDRLDAVDVDAAAGFLASKQADDGSFRTGPSGAWAVLGVDDAGRLDALDADGARAYLLDQQRDHGGFAAKGFAPGPNPMVAHALVLDALDRLGAL